MLMLKCVKAHTQLQIVILCHCLQICCACFPSNLTPCSPFHNGIIDVFVSIFKNNLIGDIPLHAQIPGNIMPCAQDIFLKLSIKYSLCSLSIVFLDLLFQLLMFII